MRPQFSISVLWLHEVFWWTGGALPFFLMAIMTIGTQRYPYTHRSLHSVLWHFKKKIAVSSHSHSGIPGPGFKNDSRELQLNKWTKSTSFLQLKNYVSNLLKILQVSHQNLFTSTGLNEWLESLFEIKTLKNKEQHEWPLAEKKATSKCITMSFMN